MRCIRGRLFVLSLLVLVVSLSASAQTATVEHRITITDQVWSQEDLYEGDEFGEFDAGQEVLTGWQLSKDPARGRETAQLLLFNQTVTAVGALAAIERLGLRPGTDRELLQLNSEQPELAKEAAIIQLGSIQWMQGERCFIFLVPERLNDNSIVPMISRAKFDDELEWFPTMTTKVNPGVPTKTLFLAFPK